MLEVVNVSKYYGALAAVREVSFTARPGEVLGYLGPSGSGKSTTVNMVAGLLEPSDGEIRVDGENIHRDILGHRRRIGYVPETPDLYSYLTGPEYLTLVGRLRQIEPDVLDEKIERFLRLFGIYDDRHARLAAYSKGMRQKVLIHGAVHGKAAKRVCSSRKVHSVVGLLSYPPSSMAVRQAGAAVKPLGR